MCLYSYFRDKNCICFRYSQSASYYSPARSIILFWRQDLNFRLKNSGKKNWKKPKYNVWKAIHAENLSFVIVAALGPSFILHRQFKITTLANENTTKTVYCIFPYIVFSEFFWKLSLRLLSRWVSLVALNKFMRKTFFLLKIKRL